MIVVSLLVAVMVNVWFVSPGPALTPLKLTRCCAAFSKIAGGLLIVPSVGDWLTAVTVTGKLWVTLLMPPLAVPPLSVTVTVIVAVPLVKSVGVKEIRPVVFGLV